MLSNNTLYFPTTISATKSCVQKFISGFRNRIRIAMLLEIRSWKNHSYESVPSKTVWPAFPKSIVILNSIGFNGSTMYLVLRCFWEMQPWTGSQFSLNQSDTEKWWCKLQNKSNKNSTEWREYFTYFFTNQYKITFKFICLTTMNERLRFSDSSRLDDYTY